MKWLKKRLRNWINDEKKSIDEYLVVSSPDEPDGKCIRFKVFRANGGTVVQTDYYDHKNDKDHNNLHVIVEGQDLGQELGKIITFESLKL
jgi:hypothetical protein